MSALAHVAPLCLASCLLVYAGTCDIRRRRIANTTAGALALAGLLARGLDGGPSAGLSGLAAGGAVLVGLVWPWSRGLIGGGDIKLAAAAAVWTGWALLPPYLLGAALAGGAIALACLLWSAPGARREMVGNLAAVAALRSSHPPIRGGAGRVSVPYGLAFALAALVVLWREALG